MTNEYIQEQVVHYQDLINTQLDPTVFTLNPEIQDYVERIEFFQKQCNHKITGSDQFSVNSEGFCEYCGLPTKHLEGNK